MTRSAPHPEPSNSQVDIRLSVPSAWGAALRKWLMVFAVGGAGAGGTSILVAQTGNTQAAESVEIAKHNAAELHALKAALSAPKTQADIEAAATRTATREAQLAALVLAVDELRRDVREIRRSLRSPGGPAASPAPEVGP